MKLDNIFANEEHYNPPKPSKKKIILNIIYYVVGTILSFIFLLPIFYMIATSTKTDDQIAQSAGTIMMFIPNFEAIGNAFNNYAQLFGEYEIWKYAINSIIYAAITIVLNVLVNGLAGYVLAKFHFPGKKFFLFLILFLIIVPVETSIIPLYMIAVRLLKLTGALSPIAVVMPGIISIFNIFLYMQFFSSIPKEYEEAMHIDGANKVRIFFDLILPLSKPIVATTAVFCFIGVWNDFLWPQLVLPTDLGNIDAWPVQTIQAFLIGFQSIPEVTGGEKMAALVVTTVPIFIVYALAQKYIVKGFGTAGLKL
jgi:fructooligosaccharide transport system permease protein